MTTCDVTPARSSAKNAKLPLPEELLLLELKRSMLSKGRHHKLVVTDDTPTGDAALDEVLAMIGASGRNPRDLASERPPTAAHGYPLQLYLERLVARGLVHAENARVLGSMRAKHYPATDTRAADEIRTRIRDALSGRRSLDARTAALTRPMFASSLEHRVFARRERKLALKRTNGIALGQLMETPQAEVLITAGRAIRAALTPPDESAGGGAG